MIFNFFGKHVMKIFGKQISFPKLTPWIIIGVWFSCQGIIDDDRFLRIVGFPILFIVTIIYFYMRLKPLTPEELNGGVKES